MKTRSILRFVRAGSLAAALLAAHPARGANTNNVVVAGAADLGITTTATYTTASPGITTDVTFAIATTYANAGTLVLNNAALSIGTLNDLNATAISITANKLLTLNTAANSVSGTAADLLYVAGGGSLTFNDSAGITFANTGSVHNLGTLSLGTSPVTINPVKTLTFTGAGTTTLGGNIANTTGALTVNSAGGTVTLSGMNLYTGLTTVAGGGTLRLLGATGSLSSGSGLFMGVSSTTYAGGSAFIFDNVGASGATSQTMASLASQISQPNENVVQVTRTAAQPVSLVFTAVTSNVTENGNVINFITQDSAGGGLNGTDHKIVLGGGLSSLLGSGGSSYYRIINQNAYFNGADFAVYDGQYGFVRAVNYGVDANSATSAGATFAATDNQQITAGVSGQGSVALGTTTSGHNGTLKISGASDLSLSSGATLTINGSNNSGLNGILKTGGTPSAPSSATISGGTIAFSAGPAQNDIRVDTAYDTLNISSALTLTTAVRFLKSGAGTLNLSAGTFSLIGNASGNNGTTSYVNGGILEIGGNATIIPNALNTGTKGAFSVANGALIWYNSTSTGSSIASVIQGQGGLTISAGVLTLTGANTYIGATSISGGVLVLDKSGSGALASTSALNLAGTFTIKGKSTGTTTQTLGNLTLTAGASELVLDPNNGTDITLILGSAWTRATGSTLLLDYSSGNAGTRQVVTATATTGLVLGNGIYGAVLVKDTAGVTGFGTRAAGSNMPITRYDDTTGTTLAETSDDATLNFTTLGTTYSGGTLNWTNGGTLTNRSVNSLTIDTTANFGTIDLGAASNILALASGAILCKGANDETLTGGQLGAAASEVIVHHTGAGTLTIHSPVSSGAGALTKDGPGTVVLDSAQGYTGPTSVNGGTLRLGHAGGTLVDSAPVAVSGGTLDVANSDTVGAVTLASGTISGSGILTGSSYALTNSGTISAVLAGSSGLAKSGAGTATLTAANTYTGNTTVNQGTLSLTHACLAETSTVTIATSAFLNLNFSGSDTVAQLIIGTGSPLAGGIYKSSTNAGPGTVLAQLTGTGTLAVSAGGGYATWAAAHAGGGLPNEDYDGDGVNNGVEYFMNAAPGFTANPVLNAGNTIIWTNGGNISSSAYGIQYVVQTSSDLVSWVDVPLAALTTNTDGPGGSLTYTLAGPTPRFVRLKVTPN